MTAVDVLAIYRKRRSVRKYTGEPIPEADLEIILEAGRWAATSNNRQARRFALIAGDQVPGFSAEAKMQPWVAGAGALVVGWSTIAESLGAAADVTISLTQMETAAVALGYGTCWLGIWNQEAVTGMIRGGPEGRAVSVLAIGRPAATGAPKDKLPLARLVGRGRLPES